ncbi:hypothetical protein N624_2145 [Levilactobacillus brevis]|nr:hypothetical protein N624_2145 [Levilactobacillus brevis]
MHSNDNIASEKVISRQITSLIRTSPESFNGSLLMMYF